MKAAELLSKPCTQPGLGLLHAIRYFAGEPGWDLFRAVEAGQADVNIQICAAAAECRGGRVGPYV